MPIHIHIPSHRPEPPRGRPMTGACPLCGTTISVKQGRGSATTLVQATWLHIEQEHREEARNRGRRPRIY